MKKAIRRVLGLAMAGCVLLGPSLAGATSAQASMARTSALPPDPCTWGYDDGHQSTVPTASRPGVRLRQWIPVHNHQSVVIPNAYVNFLTVGDVQRRAPKPAVW